MLNVALVGDVHICPVHGPNTVLEGGSGSINGRPIARFGDKCACGCFIIQGSTQATLDNRPVAFMGCKTTLGGSIIATGTAMVTS